MMRKIGAALGIALVLLLALFTNIQTALWVALIVWCLYARVPVQTVGMITLLLLTTAVVTQVIPGLRSMGESLAFYVFFGLCLTVALLLRELRFGRTQGRASQSKAPQKVDGSSVTVVPKTAVNDFYIQARTSVCAQYAAVKQVVVGLKDRIMHYKFPAVPALPKLLTNIHSGFLLKSLKFPKINFITRILILFSVIFILYLLAYKL